MRRLARTPTVPMLIDLHRCIGTRSTRPRAHTRGPRHRRQSRTEVGEGRGCHEVVQDQLAGVCGLPAHPLDDEEHLLSVPRARR